MVGESDAHQTEAAYRRTADGEVLLHLDSGIMLIRRTKHEWIDRLEGLRPEALRQATMPIRGSKFLKNWSLTAYVRWLSAQIGQLGWTSQTSPREIVAGGGGFLSFRRFFLPRRPRGHGIR